MSKEENVIKFYVTCNKLKNVIRTGWKDWNVKRERLESVAEHVYGVQMLAIAMKYEFQYDIDMMKVIFMLAIHEIGESVIGDLTLFDISKEEKNKIEMEAVSNILKGILNGKEIEELFIEFEERKTKEAQFAFYCDKLECDLQCKIYDEEHCVDLSDQESNNIINDPMVNKLLMGGESWSSMWLNFGQERYKYDEYFTKVSNYVKENGITKLVK